MSDSLRDQLLNLGYKPAPAKPARGKPARGPGKPGHGGARGPGKPGSGGKGGLEGRSGSGKPGPRQPARGAGKSRRGGDMDLGKAYAIRAQQEKQERIAAEQAKQEQARRRREARAALAAFLEGKALNDAAADVARHFEYGGKIKRIHVTPSQLKALNAGELGVVQLNGRYLLVTAAVLAGAEAIFPDAVALRVDPAAPPSGDDYADPRFQVPDDLVW